MDSSIFLSFTLPNAATWFYFSLILSITLFFQFTRLMSVRNLDLIMLFLLVPGFLFLQEAHGLISAAGPSQEPGSDAERLAARGQRELVLAYAWLVGGCVYWFGRSLFDLALVRRPALAPNLNTPGLAFLGLALIMCLGAVAVRRPNDPSEQALVGKRPIPISQVREGATAVVQQAQTETGNATSTADVQFWVERGLAMLCHLAIVIGLLMIGVRHFGDWNAGMAMGGLYLLIPYTAYHIGQFHHVWPAAFVTWAVFCYRRPNISGWLLGLAAGTTFFPVLLLPLWAGFYARRGTMRFAFSFLSATLVSVGVMLLILWFDGRAGGNIASAMNVSDWQPWKVPKTESLWMGAHWAYRLPIFVLYVAFLIGVMVWPSPKNLSHLVALSAAVMIGIQFWYADRGGVYVLWYMPMLLLMVFRPNLTGHEPPALEPGTGMLNWASAAWRRLRGKQSSAPSKELAV